jgi:hypothetical protein
MIYKILKTNDDGKIIYAKIDDACIPFNLYNTDYQEYLKWLEEGNTPLPAEENN